MAIIQVWSAPSCQSGAICFGALAPWLSAAGSESAGTPASFRLTVTRDVADRASLSEGRCLRVISQSRGEQWWFVSSVSDSDGDAGIVQVTAGPLRQLLTVRGLVRSSSTFAFTPGKQTVSTLLSTYVLTNLTDDGLSWISLGTVDFTDTLEIGSLTRVTRAAVLDQIETATGHTARLRALTSGGVLTGFALDVVSDPAAGLDTIPLAAGVQQIQRTRDALRAATVGVPFDASGSAMQQTAWVIDSVSGTAPAWIVLRDLDGSNPWPIREDDQAIGAYLLQTTGTASSIVDSRASDSAVQVASVGTLAAGQLVTIVADTVGRPVVEVTSPAGIAGPRGRLVATIGTRVTDTRRNLARNGRFSDWVSSNEARYWAAAGTSSTNVKGSQYPRNASTADTSATFSATTSVTYAAGVAQTTLSYTGATAGRVLLSGERVRVAVSLLGGTLVRIASTVGVHVVDGTGAGTVAVDSFTPPVQYDAGQTITMEETLRPSSFPTDNTTQSDALYLTNTVNSGPPIASNARLQASAVTVKYRADAAILRAAAGCSFRSRSASGAVNAAITIIDTVTGAPNGTILATGSSTSSFSSAGTIHETLSCAATIAADRTVTIALYAGTAATFVRWASLWLDSVSTTDSVVAMNGSGSNALWHRAQDVLASSATGTRYTVRGVDLTRLQTENGALALGQSVRLRSELLGVDATVKIVKLDYDFAATESLNLELGAITPRLTGVTVSL